MHVESVPLTEDTLLSFIMEDEGMAVLINEHIVGLFTLEYAQLQDVAWISPTRLGFAFESASTNLAEELYLIPVATMLYDGEPRKLDNSLEIYDVDDQVFHRSLVCERVRSSAPVGESNIRGP